MEPGTDRYPPAVPPRCGRAWGFPGCVIADGAERRSRKTATRGRGGGGRKGPRFPARHARKDIAEGMEDEA